MKQQTANLIIVAIAVAICTAFLLYLRYDSKLERQTGDSRIIQEVSKE